MKFTDIESKISNKNWLSFFLDLGRIFYDSNKTRSENLHLCISVPFLNYLSIAIGLGICDKFYSSSAYNVHKFDDLKEGTLVFRRPPNSKKEQSYVFVGIDSDGYPQFKSKHRPPVTLTLRNQNWWEEIRIAPEQVKYKRNRFSKNERGKAIRTHYESQHVDSILRKPDIKVLFVGNVNRITMEMEESLMDEYTFIDWLLPKSLVGAQNSYVTEIISSKASPVTEEINAETVIIYDGVQAFNQSPYRNYENASIILLERNASEALLGEALQDIYNYEVNTDEEFIEMVSQRKGIPKNLEILAWRRGG
ncbi:hypothetical protein [Bacillus sp. FJAT-50079]|uniref:hypothetical protein n=1 Tax=Bacillus sp. FJAT-50079 TaxID=2833577 RepID=UPI001BC9720E|nr:hypothetical protein [Bacillus sp. FJAT-50079]MBS4208053.1 hypothetical protein [Bacillus sp. FJAT-50079]